MKTKIWETLVVFAISSGLVLSGCGSAPVASTSNPQERLNPKMSAQQKAAAIKHKRDNEDLPTP